MKLISTPIGYGSTSLVQVRFDDTDACLHHFGEMHTPQSTSRKPSHEVLIALGVPVSFIDEDGYVFHFRHDAVRDRYVEATVKPRSSSFHRFLAIEEEGLNTDVEYEFVIDYRDFNLNPNGGGKHAGE